MMFYCLTVCVTYKTKFRHLIKNSFILTIGLLPRNILFLALSLSPLLILLIFGMGSMISQLLIGVVLLIGLSLGVVVWTIYSHWVFDTFINDKVEGAVKNRGLYEKMGKDGKPVPKKQSALAARFENPKKKKAVKPVTDEDIAITELPAAFRREDLLKLEAEKETMRADSAKWADAHKDDLLDADDDGEYEGDGGEDDGGSENWEDAMRLEGGEPDGADGFEDEPDSAAGRSSLWESARKKR
jgi:hypothetical protein